MATRACPRHTWFRLQFLFLRSRFAVLTFMTVAVRSFAKINLGLYIGARRADGFHELRTVYQTIALHDVIRVAVGAARGLRFGATIHVCRSMLRTPVTGWPRW